MSDTSASRSRSISFNHDDDDDSLSAHSLTAASPHSTTLPANVEFHRENGKGNSKLLRYCYKTLNLHDYYISHFQSLIYFRYSTVY